MRVITPLDLRRSLGAILDAASAGERVVIERDRRPLAVLVSVEDGRRLDTDQDEVRRRRLAALERLATLAEGLEPTLAAAPSVAAARRPAVGPFAAEAASATAAAQAAGGRDAEAASSIPGPPSPGGALSSAAATGEPRGSLASAVADPYEDERRRHDREGLVGLGG